MKAVFIDIDGTLRSGAGEMLEYNISVIKKVRALGHKVFLNTGRALANIPHDIDVLGDFDGAVLANGGHLIVDGKTVYNVYMDKELLIGIFEKIDSLDFPLIFEGDKKVLGYSKGNTIFPEYIKTIKNINELKEDLEKENYNKAVYWGVLPDKMLIENISPKLKALQIGGYGEILMKKIDKVNGMKEAIKLLGIEQKDTIAIGDSINDYDAMKFSGYSIAMKNAQSEILEIADFISDSCENGGVGKALEIKFLKNF